MGLLPETYGPTPWPYPSPAAQQYVPLPNSQDAAYAQMRARESQNVTALAFPDTRLTAERLWVSSALSVLRTREQEALAAFEAHDDPRWLLYRDAVALFTDLLAELTWQESQAVEAYEVEHYG